MWPLQFFGSGAESLAPLAKMRHAATILHVFINLSGMRVS